MGAVWSKNEVVARKRRVTLRPQSSVDASWAPRETDFTGFVWIRQSSDDPHLAVGTGTIANKRKVITFAGFDFTADDTTDEIDAGAAHDLETGDGPFVLTNAGGALPAGLAVLTNYWFISTGANTGKLATSAANAYAGTAVDITDTGTGTHSMNGTGGVSQRGIDGLFEYEATQTETDIDTSEWDVLINDGTYEAYSTVAPSTSAADVLDSLVEDTLTLGDIIRGMWAVLAGTVTDYSSGSYTYTDPSTGAIDRLTFTADNTGRLTVTIVNLTGP